MIVRAIKKFRQECPEMANPLIPEAGAYISVGCNYSIHAIAICDGIVLVQTIDDLGYPAWLPGLLFELIDGSIPCDWKCNFFSQSSGFGIAVVIGPDFLSRNAEAYDAMIELDADQVDRFWKRIKSLPAE